MPFQQFCRVFTKEPEMDLLPFLSITKEVKINLNVETVRKKILSISINKAIGSDKIHPRILKDIDIALYPHSKIIIIWYPAQ